MRLILSKYLPFSVLCGIGFTMSIFIAGLAFEGAIEAYNTYSKLGILVGSTMAAVVGYLLLNSVLPKLEAEAKIAKLSRGTRFLNTIKPSYKHKPTAQYFVLCRRCFPMRIGERNTNR